MVDKNYCMSSYLTFRYISDDEIDFFEGFKHKVFKRNERKMVPINTYKDIEKNLIEILEREIIPNKTALLLSGGMDSAILASYMPKGTKTYTLRCISNNSTDETKQAEKYTIKYQLEHKIIDVTWQDYLDLIPVLFEKNKVPFHSINPQLLKASLVAKNDGIEKIIVGESADIIFGGLDKLLSKDWYFEEFVNRYTFVDPKLVLKEPISMLHIYEKYKTDNNLVDVVKFISNVLFTEAATGYMNAFNSANIDYVAPYSYMYMNEPLNLDRIRKGEPKYLIRELFKERYPDINIQQKTPMPRSVNEWLKNWEGPKREEFRDDIDINNFTGDQKWLIYCLERYLNYFDK
ncbi:asparagine synthase-related protein [Brachyspira pilosicoli]